MGIAILAMFYSVFAWGGAVSLCRLGSLPAWWSRASTAHGSPAAGPSLTWSLAPSYAHGGGRRAERAGASAPTMGEVRPQTIGRCDMPEAPAIDPGRLWRDGSAARDRARGSRPVATGGTEQ
jgi:hypothetical protein